MPGIPFLPRRPTPLLWAGAVGTVALAGSVNPTLSAFTARITNSSNSASVATVVMQEQLTGAAGPAPCTSTIGSSTPAPCGVIDKYGGTLAPLRHGGAAATTGVTLTNAGSAAARSLTLAFAPCTTTTPATDLHVTATSACPGYTVTVKGNGTTLVGPATAEQLAGRQFELLTTAALGTAPVAAGQSVALTFEVRLTSSEDTVGGLSISQPITWTFST